MFMHEITLDGYAAQCAEQPIRLGTAGSYGVEALRITRNGEWVDYDIIVAFHPPEGETVQIRLDRIMSCLSLRRPLRLQARESLRLQDIRTACGRSP